ncbi:MAG TPA: autotransporter-associated beta strand repeat-containing protein [Chlorobaculum sp.]|nr:autotransporter-associated beta strand repeat-containing protein [Chlorobaculum sp.]
MIDRDENLGDSFGTVTLAGGTLESIRDITTTRVVTVNQAPAGSGLSPDAGTTLTLSRGLNGNGDLTLSGGGRVQLNGAGNYGGVLTVAHGTLGIGVSNMFGTGTPSGSIVTSGSVIDYSDGVENNVAIEIASNTTKLNVSTGTATQSGVISEDGMPRPLEKTGAGTLVLTGTNTYTGTTTISAGTLELNNAGGNALSDSGFVFLRNGATLKLDIDETIGALGGEQTSNVDLGSNRLTLNGTGHPEDFYSGLVSGTGGLTINGDTLTLSGNNDFLGYTGDTIITSGKLILLGGHAINDNGNVIVTEGGTIELSNDEVIGTLQSRGTIDGYSTLTARTYDFNGGVVNANLGTGSLIQGTGTLLLNGASQASTVTIDTGSLQLGGDDRLDKSAEVTFKHGGVLDLAGNNQTVASISDEGSGNGHISLNDGTLTVSSGNFGGTISGSDGNLVINGGTLTLSGNNSYTGGTTLESGTLVLGNNLALGTGQLAMADATTLKSAKNGLSVGNSITLSGSDTIDTNSNTLTLSGKIDGSGALSVRGDGTLILTGTNTYRGGTTVNAGTLVGNTTSLQGAIRNDSALVFDQGSDGMFASTINGGGVVTKRGIGTLTLSGDTKQGGLNLAQGALVSAGTIDLGPTGNLALGDSTTLTVDAASTVNAGKITGGAGNHTVNILGTVNATTVDLGAGINTLTVGGNAIISGIGTLGGGGGNSTIIFDGWRGDPSTGIGYLGDAVTDWSAIHVTNSSLIHLGTSKTLGTGSMTVDAGSIVCAFGYSPATYTITGNYINNGVLGMMDPNIPAADDRVTVTGNWSGNGWLGLDVNLTSKSFDQLVIKGNATGRTTVDLTEVGGADALVRPVHLDLIHIDGSGHGSFTAGKYWFNYGTGTSTYSYDLTWDPSVGSYLLSHFLLDDYPESLAVVQGVGPFIRRMDVQAVSRFSDRKEGADGWWSRVYRDSYRLGIGGKAGTRLDGCATGLQVGTDLFSVKGNDGSSTRAGLFFGNGSGDADVAGYAESKAGKLSDNAYSLGLYAETRPSKNLWLDAVVMGSSHNFDISMAGEASPIAASKLSFTGALEGGYTLEATESIHLEPQVLVIWQHIGDVGVTRADLGPTVIQGQEGVQGRIGIAGVLNGGQGRISPFVEFDALKDFSGAGSVLLTRNDEKIKTTPESTFFGGALGLKKTPDSSGYGLGYFIRMDALFGTRNASRSIMLSAGLTKMF